MALKKVTEIPTIDVVLVTIEATIDDTLVEYALDTSNKIAVEPQIETTEAVKLIIKGKLKAQKPEESTLTGHVITLTDNVFTPELVQILQGGEIIKDELTSEVTGYRPPTSGSGQKGYVSKLSAYSAQYNSAGDIVRYEKISYPNCKGTPIAFNSEDGVFRVSEYTINSTPLATESPYTIDYVETLPTITP